MARSAWKRESGPGLQPLINQAFIWPQTADRRPHSPPQKRPLNEAAPVWDRGPRTPALLYGVLTQSEYEPLPL
jgi:hypothetical protein